MPWPSMKAIMSSLIVVRSSCMRSMYSRPFHSQEVGLLCSSYSPVRASGRNTRSKRRLRGLRRTAAAGSKDRYVKLFCLPILICAHMLFSKEYVGYLAKQLTKKLKEGEFIEAPEQGPVVERVHAALLDELTLEDRINDEVRAILEAYSDEMKKTGANYQEMFKKVKNELVRKYKAVL